MIELVGSSAALVLGITTLLWMASVVMRDASIVDPWWSMLFVVILGNTVFRTALSPGKLLLLMMVGVWAVRLWSHLLIRAHGAPEDPRYKAFRKRFGPERYWWVSFFQVFVLQGALAMVVSTTLQVSGAAAAPDVLTWADGLGGLVFAVGFGIEVVADWQLQTHRNDPGRKGTVLDTGLWGWSRHPNYFGEALLWWGLWICSLDTPWGWATVVSPVVMTWLLVRVSGVAMMDAHMRKTRPAYAAYVDRVPGFFPRRPQR